MVRGPAPRVTRGVEVVVVHDDQVHSPLHPRTVFAQTLEGLQIPATLVDQPSAGRDVPVYVTLFGELRDDRRGVAYRPETLDQVARVCDAATLQRREVVIVHFAPPVLARQIRGSTPIVCAWSGDRCMQEAAARWLMRGGA